MQSPEQSNPNRVNPNGQKSVQDSPATADSPAAASQAPSLNLPKGGGAIRGIGEKFQANPFTGRRFVVAPHTGAFKLRRSCGAPLASDTN